MKRGVGLGAAAGLILAGVLLVVSADAWARSCVQPALGDYSVIFGARIVEILPKDKMIVALVHDFRGHETREKLIIDYGNVMVWTDRNVFERHSKWVFAFEKKARQYEIVLCKTAYIPIHIKQLD